MHRIHTRAKKEVEISGRGHRTSRMQHERISSQMESVKAVQAYINAEVHRAQKQLSPDQWQAILVGASDQGEIAAYPCRLVLPFHYPATLDELDEYGPEHFSFPKSSWDLLRQPIHEFCEQYKVVFAIADNAESVRAEYDHRRRR